MASKHETAGIFAGAMGEAQQIVVDRFHDAIETAERRGFHLGEAQAFRATVEGRASDVEALMRYFAHGPGDDAPSRAHVDAACDRLRRHFAALRASCVNGGAPEGGIVPEERDEQTGTYIVHVRAELTAHSVADARVQVASLLESGVHEDGAQNAITDYQITAPPVLALDDDMSPTGWEEG
jgi:hypothetical protein